MVDIRAMEQLHRLGVTEESRQKVEGVGPDFIQTGLLQAREKTWKVYEEIKSQIREGLTELEARKLAVEIFAGYGVKKHWHQPSIRFGGGTRMTFHQPLRTDYRLQMNDPVFMDLGPVWKDETTQIEYEGDVGDSFVLGENPDAERCIQTARALFLAAQKKWKEEKATGQQLYALIEAQAEAAGYRYIDNVVGHRVGDFPHQKYTKVELPALSFYPTGHLWILELQIVHPELPIGAFYEDLLF